MKRRKILQCFRLIACLTPIFRKNLQDLVFLHYFLSLIFNHQSVQHTQHQTINLPYLAVYELQLQLINIIILYIYQVQDLYFQHICNSRLKAHTQSIYAAFRQKYLIYSIYITIWCHTQRMVVVIWTNIHILYKAFDTGSFLATYTLRETRSGSISHNLPVILNYSMSYDKELYNLVIILTDEKNITTAITVLN